MSFWVVGGVYKNTKFEELARGEKLEKFGPFETISIAKEKWDSCSWEKVDDCFVRYEIIQKK